MTTEKSMYAFARRFARTAPVWIDHDDLEQEGWLAEWQGRKPWCAMIDALRKTKMLRQSAYWQVGTPRAYGVEVNIEEHQLLLPDETIQEAGVHLDHERQLALVYLLSPTVLWPLLMGHSHHDVADALGISMQWLWRRKQADMQAIRNEALLS